MPNNQKKPPGSDQIGTSKNADFVEKGCKL